MTIGAAFVATWRAIFQDKAALLLLFISGVIYSFFYPLPYSTETVRRVPVVVIDQDRSVLSRQLTRYAGAHPGLRVVAVTPAPHAAQELVWRGEASGMLLIPPDFSRKVLAGLAPELSVGGNGAYPLLNKTVANALVEVASTVSAGIEIKRLNAANATPDQALAWRQPLGVEALPLFNVREGYGSYVVPGVVVLVMQQTFLLAVGLLFGSWFAQGAFPFRPTVAAYAGVLHAFALAILLNCAYFFGFVFWWQDYPRGGNAWATLVLAIAFAYALAALGILVGLLFRTRERSVQLLVATALPIMFVSGLTWPSSALPPLLHAAAWLLPTTAAIPAFVATNQMGASLAEVGRELAALVALALLFGALGLARWRRRGAAPAA